MNKGVILRYTSIEKLEQKLSAPPSQKKIVGYGTDIND